jgi:hypothetical protein
METSGQVMFQCNRMLKYNIVESDRPNPRGGQVLAVLQACATGEGREIFAFLCNRRLHTTLMCSRSIV